MITFLKILFAAVFVWMSYQVVTTSLQSNLFKEWDFLGGIPWMRATLWDFYCNALPIALWMMYKQKTWAGKILWVLALVCLGSIATSAFMLVQLFRLKKGEGVKDLLLKQY